MFPILPWSDRESVKPCLSEEKVNEWCGICMGWQENQGQVKTWKRWEGEGRGRAWSCQLQQCRGASPQALGNSLSAGGSLMVALLQLLPHPRLSAACKSCGISKPSSCPKLLLFWLILRRDQHCCCWTIKSLMCNMTVELGGYLLGFQL